MKKVLAAFIFFTRLPFWRLAEVPPECYRRVVDFWSLTGWLTGGIAALTLWLAAHIMPVWMAVTSALGVRLLCTGALHEDGLADFFDGFGGGTDRERILAIMKDSHIGTYGVIGLIMYYLLAWGSLVSLPVNVACALVLAADCWSRFCASQVVNVLPYARTEQTAKNRTVYRKAHPAMIAFGFLAGALPLWFLGYPLALGALAPVVTVGLLIWFMHSKIKGYTGDCCGATYLLCELSFYITVCCLNYSL